jgi:hypothetical protein
VSGTGLYAGTVDTVGTLGGVGNGFVPPITVVVIETGTSCRDGARLACGSPEEDKKSMAERVSTADILQDKVVLNGEILYVCSDQVQETTER